MWEGIPIAPPQIIHNIHRWPIPSSDYAWCISYFWIHKVCIPESRVRLGCRARSSVLNHIWSLYIMKYWVMIYYMSYWIFCRCLEKDREEMWPFPSWLFGDFSLTQGLGSMMNCDGDRAGLDAERLSCCGLGSPMAPGCDGASGGMSSSAAAPCCERRWKLDEDLKSTNRWNHGLWWLIFMLHPVYSRIWWLYTLHMIL